MKSTTVGEVTFSFSLERGEWTMREESWSVAVVSFTVRRRPDGEWRIHIDHAGFKAYERRWHVKDRVCFSAGKRYPGFFPRRKDIPASVLTELHAAYREWSHAVPLELPPILSGDWGDQ